MLCFYHSINSHCYSNRSKISSFPFASVRFPSKGFFSLFDSCSAHFNRHDYAANSNSPHPSEYLLRHYHPKLFFFLRFFLGSLQIQMVFFCYLLSFQERVLLAFINRCCGIITIDSSLNGGLAALLTVDCPFRCASELLAFKIFVPSSLWKDVLMLRAIA